MRVISLKRLVLLLGIAVCYFGYWAYQTKYHHKTARHRGRHRVGRGGWQSPGLQDVELSERFVGDLVVAGVKKVESLTQPFKKHLRRHPFKNKLTHLNKIHKHSDNAPLSHRLPTQNVDEGGRNEGDDADVAAMVPGGPGAGPGADPAAADPVSVDEGRPDGDRANDRPSSHTARKSRRSGAHRGAHRGVSKGEDKVANRQRLTKGYRLDRKRIAHVPGEVGADLAPPPPSPPFAPRTKKPPLVLPPTNCKRPTVVWDTPMAGGAVNGFANEAISLIVPLHKLGLDIRLQASFYEESFVEQLPGPVGSVVKHLYARSQNWTLPPADVMVSQWSPPEALQHIWMASGGGYSYGNPKVRIVSRTMYEADGLPNNWLSAFQSSQIDEVWLPSEWNKRVFVNDGLDPDKVHVIGEGVDAVNVFNPNKYSRPRARGQLLKKEEVDTFVFLSVFKFETRKGWQDLVTAFFLEFKASDQVTLLLRTSLDPANERVFTDFCEALCTNHGLPEGCLLDPDYQNARRLRIMPRVPEHRYPEMYRAADSFVLASHGEGWGRPMMEAMAMSLPSIATNYSGMTAFITDQNSYPIAVSHMVPCEAEPQLKWAMVDIGLLRHALRRVFGTHGRGEALNKAKAARRTVVALHDQKLVVAKVLHLLQNACEANEADRAATLLQKAAISEIRAGQVATQV